jgi:hypothetical protein
VLHAGPVPAVLRVVHADPGCPHAPRDLYRSQAVVLSGGTLQGLWAALLRMWLLLWMLPPIRHRNVPGKVSRTSP